MDSHFHIVIETADGNLSAGMRQLDGVCRQWYNRAHGRVGHVFRAGPKPSCSVRRTPDAPRVGSIQRSGVVQAYIFWRSHVRPRQIRSQRLCSEQSFFLKALEPLGVTVVSEGPPEYGVKLGSKGGASLCLFQTEEKPAHLHLAFMADNRQQVEAFYRAALEAGGKDNGRPGLRPQYSGKYYAAFVIGPDGHNVEVVCHEPEA